MDSHCGDAVHALAALDQMRRSCPTPHNLAPGFVGLYQVNVQVPAEAPTGDGVEVVLSIGGVASNTVTIAVQ